MVSVVLMRCWNLISQIFLKIDQNYPDYVAKIKFY
jgi:hypothetical protein